MNEQQAFDEIRFIKKAILDSKRSFVDNGWGFIFWGILVFLALIVQYFLVIFHLYRYSIVTWAFIIGIGWVWSFFYYRKEYRKRSATSITGKLLGAVWTATGITITILGFAPALARAITGDYVSAFIAIGLGPAYFISGFIYESRFITYLAYGWWCGGIFMLFFPGLHTVLVMAGMMLFLQVIPGFVLYRNSKKIVAGNDE